MSFELSVKFLRIPLNIVRDFSFVKLFPHQIGVDLDLSLGPGLGRVHHLTRLLQDTRAVKVVLGLSAEVDEAERGAAVVTIFVTVGRGRPDNFDSLSKKSVLWSILCLHFVVATFEFVKSILLNLIVFSVYLNIIVITFLQV